MEILIKLKKQKATFFLKKEGKFIKDFHIISDKKNPAENWLSIIDNNIKTEDIKTIKLEVQDLYDTSVRLMLSVVQTLSWLRSIPLTMQYI